MATNTSSTAKEVARNVATKTTPQGSAPKAADLTTQPEAVGLEGQVSNDHLPTIAPSDIDRLNLEQALRDFETANVRVVDLTGRLTSLHQQMLDLHHRSSLAHLAAASSEAQRVQLELERDVARTEVAMLRASRSYRIGNLLARVAKKVTP